MRRVLPLLALLASAVAFGAVPKVPIGGKVIAPDGLTYSGTINCVLSAPATALDGATSVRVQSTGTLTIASDGTVTGSLVANDITTPVTSYTCTTRINRVPVYTQSELIYLTSAASVDWGAISRPGATPYTPAGVAGSSGAVQAANGAGGLADSGVTATAGALSVPGDLTGEQGANIGGVGMGVQFYPGRKRATFAGAQFGKRPGDAFGQSNTPQRVAFLHDSLMENTSNSTPPMLLREYALSGLGLEPLNGTAGTSGIYYAGTTYGLRTLTYGGSACTEYKNDSSTPEKWGLGGAALDCPQTATVTYALQLPYTNTKFRVWYAQRATGGTFNWAVNGGSTTPVSTSGTAGLAYTTITASSVSAANSLTLTVQSGNNVMFYAVESYADDRPGVEPLFLGRGGNRASYYATRIADSYIDTFLAAVAPDQVIIWLGTNDASASRTSAQFKADLQAIVGHYQPLVGVADIVLTTLYDKGTCPSTVDTAFQTLVGQYRTAIFEVARQYGTSVWDLARHWPAFADACSLSLYADGLHPSDKGAGTINAGIDEWLGHKRWQLDPAYGFSMNPNASVTWSATNGSRQGITFGPTTVGGTFGGGYNNIFAGYNVYRDSAWRWLYNYTGGGACFTLWDAANKQVDTYCDTQNATKDASFTPFLAHRIKSDGTIYYPNASHSTTNGITVSNAATAARTVTDPDASGTRVLDPFPTTPTTAAGYYQSGDSQGLQFFPGKYRSGSAVQQFKQLGETYGVTTITSPTVAFIGDSIMSAWCRSSFKALRKNFGNTTPGYLAFGENSMCASADDVTITKTGGTRYGYNGDGDTTPSGLEQWGVSGNSWNATSAAELKYQVNLPSTFNRVKIFYYCKSGGGIFKYAINGDAASGTSVDTSGCSNGTLGSVSITPATTPQNGDYLDIKWSSGNVTLYGAFFYIVSSSANEAYNHVAPIWLSQGGIKAQDWATNVSSSLLATFLTAVAPTQYVVALGTNDGCPGGVGASCSNCASPRTAVQYQADLGTIVAQLQTQMGASNKVDVILATQFDRGTTAGAECSAFTTTADAYRTAVYATATTYKASVWDLRKYWLPFTDAWNAGMYMAGDGTHPSEAGRAMLANGWSRLISTRRWTPQQNIRCRQFWRTALSNSAGIYMGFGEVSSSETFIYAPVRFPGVLKSLTCVNNLQATSAGYTVTPRRNGGSNSDLTITYTTSDAAQTVRSNALCTSNCTLNAGDTILVNINATGIGNAPGVACELCYTQDGQ